MCPVGGVVGRSFLVRIEPLLMFRYDDYYVVRSIATSTMYYYVVVVFQHLPVIVFPHMNSKPASSC